MNKVGVIRSLITAAVMAAYAGGALAQQAEVEPNSPVSAAQPLQFDASGVAVINAFMGNGDADVFSFQAKAGDVVTVDIDAAVKGSPVDTFVTVLQTESFGFIVMRENDDGPDGTADSYVANIVMPADGVYFVGVAGYPNRVVDGGVLSGGPGNVTGTYTLIVSGVSPVVTQPEPEPEPQAPETPTQTETPTDSGPVTSPFPQQPLEVLQIGIDIKPGVRSIAKVDPKSRRAIPVALLGSPSFNVRNVDVNSLTFGSSGDEQSLKHCAGHVTRVNRDRRPDLVCFFENADAGFDVSDGEGVLKGRLKDGTPFEGRGLLKVIAEKRKKDGRDWREERRRDRDDDDDRRKRRR